MGRDWIKGRPQIKERCIRNLCFEKLDVLSEGLEWSCDCLSLWRSKKLVIILVKKTRICFHLLFFPQFSIKTSRVQCSPSIKLTFIIKKELGHEQFWKVNQMKVSPAFLLGKNQNEPLFSLMRMSSLSINSVSICLKTRLGSKMIWTVIYSIYILL